jgi:hypothetical protein
MKSRTRSIWTEPLLPFLLRLPFAGTILRAASVLGGIGLNCLFVYSTITGNMLARRSAAPVEGRDSAPILYWIYLFCLGAPVLLLDIWALNKLMRIRKPPK